MQTSLTEKEDGAMLAFSTPDGVRREMSVAEFRAKPGGLQNAWADYAEDGRMEVHHDLVIAAAGTAFTNGQTLDAYSTGIGETGVVWNTAATFVKTDWHTSGGSEGTFAFGVAGIITGIELLYIPHAAKVATVGSSATIGQVTDSADHATQPTGYNVVSLARAMLLQNEWAWHWGENDISESGLFYEIPSNFAMSGFGTSGNNNLTQNSQFNSKARGLSKTKVVRNNEKGWFVRLTAKSALAMPVDFVALVLLKTLEIGVRRND